jgi:hypothetical protein
VKAGIGEYFAFYNERRLHQAHGYRTPMAVWRDDLQAHRQSRISSRQNPWRLDKGQQADGFQT